LMWINATAPPADDSVATTHLARSFWERNSMVSGRSIPARGWMIAALVLAMAAPAAAQFAPMLQNVYPQLSTADLDRMDAAAQRLYSGTAIGTVERWRNPDNGNSGTVALVGTPEFRGQPCRRLEYTARIAQRNQELTTSTLTWCRTESGEWKITENVPRG